ncbi:molybdopterin-dependent oxidoreductase [Dactylosporangium sp. CS-047395]|uniref:molybdopterin-dependent oxidoreductase n=1 Tax=Dactylosporangium sp. CS-047395 TaxID=3239936 RepID=UPI003D8E3FFD
MRNRLRAALSGLLAAATGVAVAELIAALLNPAAGPAVAVGSVLIDAAPTPVKTFAVRTFGTADKPALLTGIAVALAAVAVAVGLLAARRRAYGLAGAAVFAAVGAAAALSRPAAVAADVLPSIAGGLITAAALILLNRRPATPDPAASELAEPDPAMPEPAMPEPAMPEPATVDPATVDPAMPEPATVDPAMPEPAMPEPAMPEPAMPEPAMPEPATVDPATPEPATPEPATSDPATVDRRRFLATAALIGAGAVVAGAGAAAVRRSRGGAADRTRDAVRLPAASDPAPPLPAGQDPDFVTANRDFYRVDTALTVPRVDLDRWRLRIHGQVDHPRTLTFADLLDRPLTERHITLNCVSNEVGGPYIGTARWLGVPLAPLLREAGIRPGVDQVVARSTDGMTIGTPLTTVLDTPDVMLCVGMNGEPLPLEHGFPVRMLTPGLYGYAGACKWLTELELTTFDAFDAYWVTRGWAPRAPVKTASRIDRPAPLSHLPAGPATIAGVAWAQGRGIADVEIQVDNEPWQRAELLPVPSHDTWVQWRISWSAQPGLHTVRVRATDGTGAVQPEQRATPFPDGATGWHTVTVTVDP